MEEHQHHFDLHQAALAGDDDEVYLVLRNGADVNALDSSGRTALMCAVAGEHWQDIDAFDASFMCQKRLNTIRLLLSHPDITLFTLNAPQNSFNGVVPLGMAAWLDIAEAVQLLLEESNDAVLVDGMDTHGATPLMYAARDGGLGVVQLLLSHGARPDLRDRNHRSPLQYSLEHPQILYLCESVLRRHRWRESQSADRNKICPGSEDLLRLAYGAMPSDSLHSPPASIFKNQAMSRLTNTLVSSIVSSDLSFLRCLLFSPAIPPSSPPTLYPMSVPVLVNRLDSRGWSPIHYCVSLPTPCIDVLDALYCAGADVALFTTDEQFTPLHILATSAHVPEDEREKAELLYHFTAHLINELRAPLSARDRNDETCIHLAAEHGRSIDLLLFFLEFDTTGSVRDLRNSRGLTALEIAKPEFRIAFEKEKTRPVSSSSGPTIRTICSFSSLISPSNRSCDVYDDSESICLPLDFDLQELIQNFLFILCSTPVLSDNMPTTEKRCSDLIAEAQQLSSVIIHQFQRRVDEASNKLIDLQKSFGKAHAMLDRVASIATDKLEERGFDASGRKTGCLEDSQITIFNRSSRNSSTSSIAKTDYVDEKYVSIATQTNTFHDPAYDSCLGDLAEVKRYLAIHRRKMSAADADWNELASPEMVTKLKQLVKKHSKLEHKLDVAERKCEKRSSSFHPASKVMAWFKRIIIHERPALKLEIVYDLDEHSCTAAGQPKSLDRFIDFPTGQNVIASDSIIENATRTTPVVLDASRRDLHRIHECLEAAKQFVDLSHTLILRAECAMKRAIEKREACLTLNNVPPHTQQNAVKERRKSEQLCMKASGSSLFPVCSRCPSAITDVDDDDIRAVRRLLVRKIEASITGSWDEMDKIQGWLWIVREAVRGVKRRAYL